VDVHDAVRESPQEVTLEGRCNKRIRQKCTISFYLIG
jgi:hypothetical protein